MKGVQTTLYVADRVVEENRRRPVKAPPPRVLAHAPLRTDLAFMTIWCLAFGGWLSYHVECSSTQSDVIRNVSSYTTVVPRQSQRNAFCMLQAKVVYACMKYVCAMCECVLVVFATCLCMHCPCMSMHCRDIGMQTCTHGMHACLYIRGYARMYVCMYVCMNVCMHAFITDMCIDCVCV